MLQSKHKRILVMKNIYKKSGFTLVEIMICVAILAILCGIAVPSYLGYRKSTMKIACENNMKVIKNALEAALLEYEEEDIPDNDLDFLIRNKYVRASHDLDCPLDGSKYSFSVNNNFISVKCPHEQDQGHKYDK